MDSESSKLLDAVETLLTKKQKSLGVTVHGIFPGSPADKAGIKSGDVLIAVNDSPLMTMQDYIDSCNSRGERQVFDILRNNKLIQISINWKEVNV